MVGVDGFAAFGRGGRRRCPRLFRARATGATQHRRRVGRPGCRARACTRTVFRCRATVWSVVSSSAALPPTHSRVNRRLRPTLAARSLAPSPDMTTGPCSPRRRRPRYRCRRCSMDRDALAVMPEAGPVPGSGQRRRPKPGVRFGPCGRGPSACTSGARSSRPAAPSCSRRPSAGSSSSSPARPAISGWCWRPGDPVPAVRPLGRGGGRSGRPAQAPRGHPDALLPPGRAVVGAGRSGRGQRGGPGRHRRGRGSRPDRRLARPPGLRQPPGAARRPGQRGQPQRGGGQQRPGGRPRAGRRADRDGGHDGVLRAERVVLPGGDRRPASSSGPARRADPLRPDAEGVKEGLALRGRAPAALAPSCS